jgi:hypothetical protein
MFSDVMVQLFTKHSEASMLGSNATEILEEDYQKTLPKQP